MRQWRHKFPLAVSAFSWMSAAVASTFSTVLAIALLTYAGVPRRVVTESYSVALLSLQHASVPSETVPKEDLDNEVVEMDSPRNLPPPELADLVKHTPSDKHSLAPPNPGVDTISAEMPEISATVLSSLRSNYWAEVYTVIAEKLQYPMAARMRGLGGDVTIQIKIDSDGNLQEVNERKTSARMFSRAVLAAAQIAVPYPSPPEQLQTPVELEIPISFQLDVR